MRPAWTSNKITEKPGLNTKQANKQQQTNNKNKRKKTNNNRNTETLKMQTL